MKNPISQLGAIGLAIAGFTCWVFCDAAIKLAGQRQLPTFQVVAFLGLFTTLPVAAYSLLRGELRNLRPEKPKRVIIRAFLDLGNILFVVVALRHLSLTLFYILVFTSPMVVVLLGRMFLNEHLPWRKAMAIVTGFLGVVIAVDPLRSSGKNDWVGYVACAVCVSCFSAAIVLSRAISLTERPESVVLVSGLVTASAGFIGMLAHAVPLSAGLVTLLLVMGLLCALGNICVFIALRHTEAATVSQYHYTQLVSGAIVAYLMFHEKPTQYMLIGMVLIVVSGLYIAVHAVRAGEARAKETSSEMAR